MKSNTIKTFVSFILALMFTSFAYADEFSVAAAKCNKIVNVLKKNECYSLIENLNINRAIIIKNNELINLQPTYELQQEVIQTHAIYRRRLNDQPYECDRDMSIFHICEYNIKYERLLVIEASIKDAKSKGYK